MDFVVAGFGVGAILMLLGFAVRDLGPLRYRSVEQLTPIHDEWLAMCRSIGTVLVIAGSFVCVATLISLLVGVGDKTGSRSVMAIIAIAVTGCGVWSVLAIRRFVAMQPEMLDVSIERYGAVPSARSARPPRPRGRTNRPPVDESDGGDEFINEDDTVGMVMGADLTLAEPHIQPDPAFVSSLRRAAPPQELEPEPMAPAASESRGEEYGPVQPEIIDLPIAPTSSHEAPSDTAPAPRFTSRLLADVDDETHEPSEGFRSTLLSGLDTEGATNSWTGFSSSILSDLGHSTNGSDTEATVEAAPPPNEDNVREVDTDTPPAVTTTAEPGEINEVSAGHRSLASGTES